LQEILHIMNNSMSSKQCSPSPQISCCVISTGSYVCLVSCQHADLSLEFHMMEHLFIHLQYLLKSTVLVRHVIIFPGVACQ
jgi:hypothetical protein